MHAWDEFIIESDSTQSTIYSNSGEVLTNYYHYVCSVPHDFDLGMN